MRFGVRCLEKNLISDPCFPHVVDFGVSFESEAALVWIKKSDITFFSTRAFT